MSGDPRLEPVVMSYISANDVRALLDVGCGYGKWGFLFKARAITRGILQWIIGIDVFKPCLRRCIEWGVYDDVILATGQYLPFRNKTFDVALACDVLEHMCKEEGICLLKESERVTRHQIIITTPNGFMRQEALHDNPFEVHKSGWMPHDLKRLGFLVRGVGIFRKDRNRLKILLERFLAPFAYYFPTVAFLLVGLKRVK